MLLRSHQLKLESGGPSPAVVRTILLHSDLVPQAERYALSLAANAYEALYLATRLLL